MSVNEKVRSYARIFSWIAISSSSKWRYLPDFEVPQPQLAETDARQVKHVVAYSVQHTPDLAGFPLGDGHSQDALFLTSAHHGHLCSAKGSVIQIDTVAEMVQGSLR